MKTAIAQSKRLDFSRVTSKRKHYVSPFVGLILGLILIGLCAVLLVKGLIVGVPALGRAFFDRPEMDIDTAHRIVRIVDTDGKITYPSDTAAYRQYLKEIRSGTYDQVYVDAHAFDKDKPKQ